MYHEISQIFKAKNSCGSCRLQPFYSYELRPVTFRKLFNIKRWPSRCSPFFILSRCFTFFYCFKRTWGQKLASFIWHNFMEKEHCTKFCGALISSHVVTKVWIRRECVTLYPRMCKTFHPWFSWQIFVNFLEKEPFTQFYVSFWPFIMNLLKLRSFEWLNCVST